MATALLIPDHESQSVGRIEITGPEDISRIMRTEFHGTTGPTWIAYSPATTQPGQIVNQRACDLFNELELDGLAAWEDHITGPVLILTDPTFDAHPLSADLTTRFPDLHEITPPTPPDPQPPADQTPEPLWPATDETNPSAALYFPAPLIEDEDDRALPSAVRFDHINEIGDLYFPRGWETIDGDGWSALIGMGPGKPNEPVNTEATVFLNRNHPEGGFRVYGPMLVTGGPWPVPSVPAPISAQALAIYQPTPEATAELAHVWTAQTVARISANLSDRERAALNVALALPRQG